VEPESLTVDVPNPGTAVVRFRYTDMYEVVGGHACLAATPEGWISLVTDAPTTVTLKISPLRRLALTGDQNCG
jgi:hypothetical protein